jgi:hypothetical protein
MAVRRVSTDSRLDSLTEDHEPSVPTLGPFLDDAEHPIPQVLHSSLHQSSAIDSMRSAGVGLPAKEFTP